MLDLRRQLECLVVALVLSICGLARAAWVETRVKAHSAVIDVDANGVAEVRHEVLLGVRGGPLRTFEIQGLDPDLEVEGDGTATPIVRYGVPAPIPLALARQDDGTLRIEFQRERGLFTGTYSLRFAYRTRLLARDRIRRRGAAAEIEWIGPRFADGIDVAKVVFRLPAAATAPTLAPDDNDSEGGGGAFVSGLRHDGDKVELELVRPHVARGEPAVWRILADSKCFSSLPSASGAPASRAAARLVSIERPSDRAGWLIAAIAVALAYAGLVVAKAVCWARDGRPYGIEPRAWVRVPLPLRAALSGAFLSGAAVLGALGDHPNVAVLLLLASMLFAALRPPRATTLPRGPGQWFALTETEAFARGRERRSGRWLDMGQLPGFALLCLLLAGFAAGAVYLASRSPYSALAVCIAAASLWPIFANGRASSLPRDRAIAPRRLLARVSRELGRTTGVKVVPWARIPTGAERADELRLLVRLATPSDGLTAIEVGVDYAASAAGYIAQPFVIVRAREDSAAQRALAGRVRWQRGRTPEERVAIVKAGLPAAAPIAELVRAIIEPLRDASRARARSTASNVRLRVPSPAHAA